MVKYEAYTSPSEIDRQADVVAELDRRARPVRKTGSTPTVSTAIATAAGRSHADSCGCHRCLRLRRPQSTWSELGHGLVPQLHPNLVPELPEPRRPRRSR